MGERPRIWDATHAQSQTMPDCAKDTKCGRDRAPTIVEICYTTLVRRHCGDGGTSFSAVNPPPPTHWFRLARPSRRMGKIFFGIFFLALKNQGILKNQEYWLSLGMRTDARACTRARACASVG
jgi:hypothetical protein